MNDVRVEIKSRDCKNTLAIDTRELYILQCAMHSFVQSYRVLSSSASTMCLLDIYSSIVSDLELAENLSAKLHEYNLPF